MNLRGKAKIPTLRASRIIQPVPRLVTLGPLGLIKHVRLSGTARFNPEFKKFLKTFSLSNTAETDLLELLFQNTDWAGIGDAGGLRGSVVAGSFYISLHTADPGEAGDQTTSETNYGGYTRMAVARSSSGWDVSGNNCSNHAAFDFPTCSSGSATLTHFAVGRAVSSTGQIVCSGALGTSIPVAAGITPGFAANELDVNAD